jgi:putative ABC transport system permease protein
VFLGVVLILGAVILILLSSIAIRERKYEIGVLRAMGMKKNKVAAGLLTEIVTITAVCLILGLGTGIAAAQPISDMLLENQLSQIESDDNNTAFGPRGMTTVMGQRIGGGPGIGSPAEALKEMDVSLNVLTIAEIMLVSLALAVLASIAGITHITKYEPIKILSDRT